MICITQWDARVKQDVSSASCGGGCGDTDRRMRPELQCLTGSGVVHSDNMARNSPAIGASDQISSGPSMHFPNADRDRGAVEFSRFLDRTDGISQPKQLFDLLSDFALGFGCIWIAYGPLTADRKVLNPIRCAAEQMLNYPDEWQEQCLRRGYDRIAPTFRESRLRAGPIRWREVYSDARTTAHERRILDEAATFGLRSGITVPLRGPYGSFAILSFAQRCNNELQNRTITYLQHAAIHFHLTVADATNSKLIKVVPDLSVREKECILWVARGKSSWDIGVIMRISENTVNFHIKNVMRKLDTSSRTVAAIKAISLGIIAL
ncbi:LuxR family transcriptional regulator (plasmid) [Sinorhizobium numidicum]|uniref:LuxR family transcriptional regulator n=1 Tax=Sinorhizobium numidicum TaxID=680248 RepID=A0ABY8D474_9HYPH|nr:LuxR family transcriptional regulator [Sinorhizobium numidicum]WEX79373.1 LuxR family transcriptional regulator [Sinorhizobium numidicum]WEX85670.1 LuxR family transcriptional regulator [Sinorhizobium numidicum]